MAIDKQVDFDGWLNEQGMSQDLRRALEGIFNGEFGKMDFLLNDLLAVFPDNGLGFQVSREVFGECVTKLRNERRNYAKTEFYIPITDFLKKVFGLSELNNEQDNAVRIFCKTASGMK